MFADHGSLLDSGLCDIVVIATPNMTHAQILLDVLAHPKRHHVLVEKPLCTTVEDCYKVNPSSPCFCLKQREHLNWSSAEQSQIRTPQRELLKRDCDNVFVQFRFSWVARQSNFAKTKRSVNQSQLSQGMSQRELLKRDVTTNLYTLKFRQ